MSVLDDLFSYQEINRPATAEEQRDGGVSRVHVPVLIPLAPPLLRVACLMSMACFVFEVSFGEALARLRQCQRAEER